MVEPRGRAPSGGDAAGRRDRLLGVAREVVEQARRDGADPARVGAALHDAWRRAGAGAAEFEPGFTLDAATGVEALAFLVRDTAGPDQGGLVLRLPGELPDSFEAVAPVPGGPRPLEGLRLAYLTRPA